MSSRSLRYVKQVTDQYMSICSWIFSICQIGHWYSVYVIKQATEKQITDVQNKYGTNLVENYLETVTRLCHELLICRLHLFFTNNYTCTKILVQMNLVCVFSWKEVLKESFLNTVESFQFMESIFLDSHDLLVHGDVILCVASLVCHTVKIARPNSSQNFMNTAKTIDLTRLCIQAHEDVNL